mmetsp:Transcript_859/g.1418  ORF Transcript_859/g.1418 Transcript_859/m.1418 type:complete len:591 (-) Transcript_859:204-1976(-)
MMRPWMDIGDFAVLKELGRGCGGAVHLARRKADQRLYALKSLTLPVKADAVSRVLREVHILASFENPFVVRYFDSFLHEGRCVLVMEHCSSGSLYELLEEKQQESAEPESPPQYFEETQVWKWALQLGLALHEIHKHRVVHRDIKPHNLFISGDDLKVGDFGVARLLGDNLATTIIGSPKYMAPEIYRGDSYDASADLWSMGVTLAEMTNLKHPFSASNQHALALQIMEVPKGTSRIPQYYSPAMADLVSNCMLREAKERPSARDMLFTPAARRHLMRFGLSSYLPAVELPPPLAAATSAVDLDPPPQKSGTSCRHHSFILELLPLQSGFTVDATDTEAAWQGPLKEAPQLPTSHPSPRRVLRPLLPPCSLLPTLGPIAAALDPGSSAQTSSSPSRLPSCVPSHVPSRAPSPDMMQIDERQPAQMKPANAAHNCVAAVKPELGNCSHEATRVRRRASRRRASSQDVEAAYGLQATEQKQLQSRRRVSRGHFLDLGDDDEDGSSNGNGNGVRNNGGGVVMGEKCQAEGADAPSGWELKPVQAGRPLRRYSWHSLALRESNLSCCQCVNSSTATQSHMLCGLISSAGNRNES